MLENETQANVRLVGKNFYSVGEQGHNQLAMCFFFFLRSHTPPHFCQLNSVKIRKYGHNEHNGLIFFSKIVADCNINMKTSLKQLALVTLFGTLAQDNTPLTAGIIEPV